MRQTAATVMARTLSQGLAQESQAEYAAAGTVSGVFIPTGGAIVQKIYGQEYAGDEKNCHTPGRALSGKR